MKGTTRQSGVVRVLFQLSMVAPPRGAANFCQHRHWIVVLAAIATVIPAAKALSRVGLSRWWAILSIVPIVGWFGLWAFAYARWPRVDS